MFRRDRYLIFYEPVPIASVSSLRRIGFSCCQCFMPPATQACGKCEVRAPRSELFRSHEALAPTSTEILQYGHIIVHSLENLLKQAAATLRLSKMAQKQEQPIEKKPKSFEALTPALAEWILDYTRSMGFARTTPVQAMAIPLLMGNKDLVVEVRSARGGIFIHAILIAYHRCRLSRAVAKRSPSSSLSSQGYSAPRTLTRRAMSGV